MSVSSAIRPELSATPSEVSAAGLVGLVVRREMADHLRSFRFLALCSLMLVLMPLGAFINVRDFERRSGWSAALREDARKHLEGSERPDWGFETFRPDPALRAIRDPQPLSFLAMGLDALLPTYWQFDSMGSAAGPPVTPEFSRGGLIGDVDLLFVVQVVLGLLALLLAFDAVSGEKEAGTLRATLGNSVPRVLLLAGKYLALLFTVLAPLALGTLAALVVAQAMGVPLVNAATLGRVALVLFAAAAYVLALSGLGLLVSATTHRSRTSLVLLLVLWVGLILVLPRFATVLSAALRPVAPVQVADHAQRVSILDLDGERRVALAALWKEISGKDTLPDAPELRALDAGQAPVLHDQLTRYLERQKEIDRGFYERKRKLIRDIDGTRERELETQRRLTGVISRLSPAAVFGFVATDAVGTGELERRRLEQQVLAHQQTLESVYWDTSPGFILIACGGKCEYSDEDHETLGRRAPAVYADLPVFSRREASLGEIVRHSLRDLGLLVLFGLASLGGAALAFNRYDVR